MLLTNLRLLFFVFIQLSLFITLTAQNYCTVYIYTKSLTVNRNNKMVRIKMPNDTVVFKNRITGEKITLMNAVNDEYGAYLIVTPITNVNSKDTTGTCKFEIIDNENTLFSDIGLFSYAGSTDYIWEGYIKVDIDSVITKVPKHIFKDSFKVVTSYSNMKYGRSKVRIYQEDWISILSLSDISHWSKFGKVRNKTLYYKNQLHWIYYPELHSFQINILSTFKFTKKNGKTVLESSTNSIVPTSQFGNSKTSFISLDYKNALFKFSQTLKIEKYSD